MQDESNKNKRMSIGEAADYLGISIDTLRRWEKKGKINALRSPGGHRYFNKTDLDKLFGTKYERTENTKTTKPKDDASIKKPQEIEKNEIDQIPTPAYDTPAPPPIPFTTYPSSVSENKESATSQTTPTESLQVEKATSPKQQPKTNENRQIESPQTTQQTESMPTKPSLTTLQERKLSEIIKDKSDKDTYAKITKIIFVGLIIFGIVDIIIAYIWFTQSSIVSPIP